TDRAYFKDVRNKSLSYPDRPDSQKIYLDPVYSRSDGSFRAVMSKESLNKPMIAVISVDMKSLINTIQPRELNFCMLNLKGEILFTSVGNEHLNENLSEELENGIALNNAI